MFELSRSETWDDMFRTMDALMQYPLKERTIETQGLKSLIHRPHNLINVTDDNGKVVGQKIEVVTTPFKKDDVKVTVEDNTLSVECGNDNEEETSEANYVFKGISSQRYSFALKLGNCVDRTAIRAKNVDGVLTITLPFKKEDDPKKSMTIEIE